MDFTHTLACSYTYSCFFPFCGLKKTPQSKTPKTVCFCSQNQQILACSAETWLMKYKWVVFLSKGYWQIKGWLKLTAVYIWKEVTTDSWWAAVTVKVCLLLMEMKDRQKVPGRVQNECLVCSMFQFLYIKRYINASRVRRGGELLWKHLINPASGNKLTDIKGLICSLEISSYVIWYLSKTHEFAKFSWVIFWAKAVTSHLWKQHDIFHSCLSTRAVFLAVS